MRLCVPAALRPPDESLHAAWHGHASRGEIIPPAGFPESARVYAGGGPPAGKAAILIDVTIVRALLVPSAMKLFGRWNWWMPTGRARVIRVEPSPLGEHRRRAAAHAGGGH